MKNSLRLLIKVGVCLMALCMTFVAVCPTGLAAGMDDDKEGMFDDPGFNDDENLCSHYADIVGASLVIGGEIALRYYVDMCDCYKSAKMRFYIGSYVFSAGSYYDEETKEYIFVTPGIEPHIMAENIKAELIFEGETVAVKDNYSPIDNCKNLIDNNYEDIYMQRFIRALMTYGAAVQMYRNYDTDNLMNYGYEIDSAIPYEEISVKKTENNDGISIFNAANVSFDKSNKITAKITSESKPTVTINGKPAVVLENGINEWMVQTEGISPIDYDKVFLFAITSNEIPALLTYSINSYTYSKLYSDDTSMADLAVATYSYGVAAEQYLESLNIN